jgi:DHA2 family multidrug resistance protein
MDINPKEKQGSAMAVWGMGVMVGPILGPTLGGWLTDSYNWRWVFFINVPIGTLAIFGVWKYMRPVAGAGRMSFDAFGFATLSLAIGSLQLLLDRGQQNDWFSSTETIIEAIAAVVMSTYFVAHTLMTPAHKSFVDFRLFKNQNFVTGVSFIFIVGLVLYATRALIPTMLETLLNYPVATTGLVTAPSGLGTMLAMLVVGRLVGKIDLRLMLFVGFMLTALALWQMAHYSLDLSEADIVWPGVIQGIGVGLVFVPLSAATFATLSPEMRAQGTGLFSLVRNIGSSLGISLVQTMLVRNTVIAHAALTERVTSSSPAWHNPAIARAYDATTSAGAAFLDGAITQQAAMIAYIDDFWLMLFLTLAVTPLLLFIQRPGPRSAVEIEADAAVME